MLTRLHPEDYDVVKPLIPATDPMTAHMHYSLFRPSGNGTPDITCFVDDPEKPTLVLLRDWSYMFHYPEPDKFLLALDFLESEDYLRGLTAEIPPHLKEEIRDHFIKRLHFSALRRPWCRMLAERLSIERENPCLVYFWEGQPPREPDLPLVELGPEYAELVESYWEYGSHDEGTIGYIRWCLETWPSPAWLDNDGEPGAWCMTHGNGSMGHIYVLPPHRRKGIALELSRAMIRRTLEDGRLPFCHIVQTNEASIRMSEKVGLRHAGEVSWITALRGSRPATAPDASCRS